ncbi:extracellular calcium-sensing receptor-like [Hydractinia symbiolongicarpus]|uniref:extracellular calcium-sensing receptor-like n=1 Tax=Hydractinia symbiolongicarpus TaxID=13093 RepID=UPI00254B12F7|nr:extracellular calcium-sensing receptor-like [Hydractinia symbiolongicarpus]
MKLVVVIFLAQVMGFQPIHNSTNFNKTEYKNIMAYYKEPCSTSHIPSFQNTQNATFIIGGMFPIHINNKGRLIYNTFALSWVEAFQFAIHEINNSTNLLPGSKLGFQIFDSCNVMSIALDAALQMTQTFGGANSNWSCTCNSRKQSIIALVGDAASSTTTKIAATLSASMTTQISYSATTTELSNKILYPNFLRTIAPDNQQVSLVVDLMRHFRWDYINIIACDDSYGLAGFNELLKQMTRYNICAANSDVYDIKNDNKSIYTSKVIRKLKKEREATVIVLWCQTPEAIKVLKTAERLKLHNRTWIATETYGAALELLEIDQKVVRGLLGVTPIQHEYHPFIEHLKSITPKTNHKNPWLKEYWMKKKKCTYFSPANYTCSDRETNLSELPTSKSINVLNSVYAIAHGLHSYLSEAGPTINDEIDREALLHHIQNVDFLGKHNLPVSFDKHGNPSITFYAISNLKYNKTSKKLFHQKIGTWNSRNRCVLVEKNFIEFANHSDKTPLSTCAENCKPGEEGLVFGNRPCCLKCVKCQADQVQPEYGKRYCIRCQQGTLPNRNQTKCIKPIITSFKLTSTRGVVLIVSMVTGYVIILFSIGVFYVNRNTPIVRASNKSLSMLQLASMLCILSLPFLCFQPQPSAQQCRIRLYHFVFFYTVAISVTFTKADRLLRIFKASRTGILAKRSIVKGNTVQFIAVAVLTIIAVFLCTATYLSVQPTIMAATTYTDHDDIHILYYCSGQYHRVLIVLLFYIAIIALICAVYAFKARKLPETHNEARYTSFAMFTFLLIWMMFIPIYFSTSSEVDRLVIWCGVSFTAIMVIYFAMYFPKLVVILFKPKKNTAELFRQKIKNSAI